MNFLDINPAAYAMSGTQDALQLSQNVGNMRRAGDARNYLAENASGIMSGNQNALAGLMAHDPQMALDQQQRGIANRSANAADGQNQQLFEMKVEEYKRGLSAEQAAADAAKIRQGIAAASAARSSEEWDAIVTQLDQPDLVGMFDQRESVFRQFLPIADALERDSVPKPADEYQRYVQEETTSGRQPLDRIQYAQAKKGNGFEVSLPDGTRVTMGGSSNNGGLQPSSPEAMIATIDGILADPALETSTGMLSPLQNIPGTPQRRFGARVKQLGGQAFLQAFESLKGAGQITEVEGQKATDAIGRLDTGQRSEDYRSALTELRDLLVKATSRPHGWAEKQGNPADSGMPQAGVTEDGYRFMGGDPGDSANWEKVE